MIESVSFPQVKNGYAPLGLFALASNLPVVMEHNSPNALYSDIRASIFEQSSFKSDHKSLIKGIEDYIFATTESDIVALSDIAVIEKGQQINGLKLNETGAYYYLNGGVVPSGYTNDYNTDKDTISISEGGNSCGFVNYNKERFWSGGHCYTLKVNEKRCNKEYLYFYLKSKEKDIMKLRVGSGLPNIQKNTLAGFCVMIPNFEMQKHIAEILTAITRKKEIETAYISQLQSQKNYLLSTLFI